MQHNVDVPGSGKSFIQEGLQEMLDLDNEMINREKNINGQIWKAYVVYEIYYESLKNYLFTWLKEIENPQ